MAKAKIIGVWANFWTGRNSPYLPESAQKESSSCLPEVIQYLDEGVRLISQRGGQVACPYTGKNIGFPTILTDGDWLWSREYLYYVREFNFEIPPPLLHHIALNAYQPPTAERIGQERLHELYTLFEGQY
ncbi:MAG: hypothetical protein D6722_26000 [Bacteroidetes bacterium]|nr:MAG: hypothetical protein D6722_26000 [Bacteroidota bacterium]